MSAATEAGGAVEEAARTAAREWMHAYGIDTRRYTAGGGDHPMMDTLPAAFEAYAAARPTAPGDDVEALRRQLADFAEALKRTNRAVLSIAAQRDAVAAALVKARADALEEAARVAESDDGRVAGNPTFSGRNTAHRIAAVIRALTPTNGGPNVDR